jgi:hypothetical protein
VLHDAELTTLSVDRHAGTACLGFQDVDGSQVFVRFEGIHTLRIADVRIQNVVSRFLMTPSGRFSGAEAWDTLVWTFDYGGPPDHALLQAKIDGGEYRLVWLNPSAGAQVGVVCNQVSIDRIAGQDA